MFSLLTFCHIFHEKTHQKFAADDSLNMDESFQDYSWIQDFEADFL